MEFFMVKPIVLALQFHKGDIQQAIELGHLIADMQESYTPDVEFVLYGAKNLDGVGKYPELKQLWGKLSQKFRTYLWDCSRFGDGYPHGPNDMWYQLNLDCYLRKREGHMFGDILFTFESDTCPTNKEWIHALRYEYDREDKDILGCITTYNGQESGKHVNGNMVLPIGFCHENNLYSCPANVAWDAYHANYFLKSSHNSKVIWNEYKCTEAKVDQWLNNPSSMPIIIHGYKGDRLREWVREKIIKKSI
jgi:hypothetical protein